MLRKSYFTKKNATHPLQKNPLQDAPIIKSKKLTFEIPEDKPSENFLKAAHKIS